MLCAFFYKRMKGVEAEKTVTQIFGAFWTELERYEHDTRACSDKIKQWEIPNCWFCRAHDDGSLHALRFLEFRVNRILGILSVSDCWDRDIGLHLAHWLDTHMHFVIQCEDRKSGPSREDAVHANVLRMCDWREERREHVTAVREAFLNKSSKNNSLLGDIYKKLVNNMGYCKVIETSVNHDVRETPVKQAFCDSFVKCILGMGSTKADFSLRKSLHRAINVKTSELFERITSHGKHEFSLVFVALRENIINFVKKDFCMDPFVHNIPRWTQFSENILNCGEMIRLRIRDRVGDGELFSFKLRAESEEHLSLVRMSKKVPGIFSRVKKTGLDIFDICKIIKRCRDKQEDSTQALEDYVGTEHIAINVTRSFQKIEFGKPLTIDLLSNFFVPESERLFVDIVKASKHGGDALFKFISVVCDDEKNKKKMAVLHTCLELLKHSLSYSRFGLPEKYADKQRLAAAKRFPNIDESEAISRVSTLIWCDGCRKVKNYVLGSNSKDTFNHLGHGYKRICKDDDNIMCFEKKRYLCCRNAPLRKISMISSDSSYAICLFGIIYTITTCCGNISKLKELFPTEKGGPLTCDRCARETNAGDVNAVKKCYYCDAVIQEKKKFYTGLFTMEDDVVKSLSFCKKHTRHFMRREREPLLLEECLAKICKNS